MKEKLTFKINKLNFLITINILILLGGFGILLFIMPSFFISSFIRSENLIFYIGAGLVIMCAFLLIGYLNIYIKGYGLVLSNNGIENNSNLTNVGIINWEDITKIRTKDLNKNKLILLFVKNDKKYYKTVKNPIIKLNLLAYRQFYGTSFVIEPKNIDCTFKTLKQSILESYKQSKQHKIKT